MFEAPDIPPLHLELEGEIQRLLDAKTKPPGSLGRLESLALQLGLVQGTTAPAVTRPAIIVFAGDHGVVADGVSAWPQAVTAEMVRNMLAGGAAINVLARRLDIELEIVDSGVAADLSGLDGLIHERIAPGTRSFTRESAMSAEERDRALGRGVVLAVAACERGSNVLGFGEMGIGNTSSAAMIMSLVADRPLSECVGAGAGLDETGVELKRSVLERALARVHAELGDDDPQTGPGALAVLAQCGGYEIAMMCGAMLGGASRRALVVVDGFIASAAALVARAVAPSIGGYLVWAHRSAERGHAAMLESAGAEPLLDLGMRLGEGTGAALAIPLLRSSAAILTDMASFAQAGVSERDHD
ncbi:MAG: nicotinate-nucleotide--dimethylbenzimidazole phosphoribosyltransferase [Gammaproteobacteria bacterium]|nr:nicotinate-nucleotide--dimethylbenzimidazole phosphoribosyltransferase [Gammaproteobacteria bacterium]